MCICCCHNMRRPHETKFKDFFVHEHVVLRTIYPREAQRKLVPSWIGILVGSMLISLFIILVFRQTRLECHDRVHCIRSCRADFPSPNDCIPSMNPAFNLSMYLYKNTSSPGWDVCAAKANQWAAGNMINPDMNMICEWENYALLCVDPLAGNACEEEKAYQAVLTGAGSAMMVITILFMPHCLAGCVRDICRCTFDPCVRNAVEGKACSIAWIVVAALFMSLSIWQAAVADTYFVWLRLGIWMITCLGTWIIAEPIIIFFRWHLKWQCGPPRYDAAVVYPPTESQNLMRNESGTYYQFGTQPSPQNAVL